MLCAGNHREQIMLALFEEFCTARNGCPLHLESSQAAQDLNLTCGRMISACALWIKDGLSE